MNGEELYALLQDLPDDFITEAVVPYRKRRISLRVIIPAIAACLAVVIAAAVYPNIRMQKPDITADPAIITETAALSTMSTANQQTTGSASVTQTAADSKTTAKTTSAAVTTDPPKQETAAEAVTTPAAQTAMSEPQPTAGTQNTGNTAAMGASETTLRQEPVQVQTDHTAASDIQEELEIGPAETRMTQVDVTMPDTPTTEPVPQTVSIPLLHLSPGTNVRESATPPNTAEGSFHIIFAAEGVRPADSQVLSNFDFDTQACLMFTLHTNCANAKVTHAEMQEAVLTVHVACTDAPAYQTPRDLRFALGIPKSLGLELYQCRTALTHSTAENPDSPDDNPETITLTIH